MGKMECKAFSTAGISDLARPRTSPYTEALCSVTVRPGYLSVECSPARNRLHGKNEHNPEKYRED
jgi:hypothetical protein